jgi:hypothetical protein
MKGDILSQWEQYLSQQCQSLVIPIILGDGQPAEWRFFQLTADNLLDDGIYFLDMWCYYPESTVEVRGEVLEKWANEQFKFPEILFSHPLPNFIPPSVIKYGWEYYCDTSNVSKPGEEKVVLYLELNFKPLIKDNTYPPSLCP